LSVTTFFCYYSLGPQFPQFLKWEGTEKRTLHFIPQELGIGKTIMFNDKSTSHQEAGLLGTGLEPGHQPSGEFIHPGNPAFVLKATGSKPFSKALLSRMECFLRV
jgi:hypothetical protein